MSDRLDAMITFSKKIICKQNFDCLAVALIDFSQKNFKSFEINTESIESCSHLYSPPCFFDLASLTKPLTLSIVYLLERKIFTEDLLLLLNHRGGIVSGGRVGKNDWKTQIDKYSIVSSKTLYSDYSALKLMLEIERRTRSSLYTLSSSSWDEEFCHWTKLTHPESSPATGIRGGRIIRGVVHDDNAFNIGGELAHSGLFATIGGLSRTLLNIDRRYSLVTFMDKAFQERVHSDRFLYGWDTVENKETSLGGSHCHVETFGHLGFTGTSIWIDTCSKRGLVILTNETKLFSYMRIGLNKFRKKIAEMAFG